MSKKVLFLIPYPLKASPSQRFRFEQYFGILNETGFKIHIQSFLDSDFGRIFYASGNTFRKAWALLRGFLKRIGMLFYAPFYDFIFIHREITPLGPPVFEWMLSKVFRKRIIYDFDDAIWLTDRDQESNTMKVLKWRGKVESICRWAYRVSCGNEYLATYAKRFNPHVVYNPTTIDTEHRHNPDTYTPSSLYGDTIVIGWTGSHSTLKYLEGVEATLQAMESRFPNVKVLVIADNKPALQLNALVFVPWNEETEIADLMEIDIGIMPLPDDEWTKGKCGFKALQYMALQKPVVASAVGVNTSIIADGKNGFLCSTVAQWHACLARLIEDKTLRVTMGKSGREKVVKHYSVISNSANFLSLFE